MDFTESQKTSQIWVPDDLSTPFAALLTTMPATNDNVRKQPATFFQTFEDKRESMLGSD